MQSENHSLTGGLADQSYWDDSYSGYVLTDESDERDAVKDWLRQYVPRTQTGRCFEIGCFPGRFLTVLGKLGYELNGLDLTPGVTREFPEWLRSRGYRTGRFYHEDFFKFSTSEKFDLVCSFGFIEHFRNWEEAFVKHIALLKPGGYLVIETPNFRGWLQRFIHRLLDAENYRRHYLPAMSPRKWAKICRRHGLEVIHRGFIGEFQFWVDKEPVTPFRKRVLKALIDHYPKLRRLPRNSGSFSPYCGIIAQLKPGINEH